MPNKIPLVKLTGDITSPIIGLGTWKSAPGEVTSAVATAIDLGYRHIDCAFAYENETEVGEAIKAKMDDRTVKREDLFITTKLWNTFHSKDLVIPALKTSLKNLGLSYVDLYLMHWPLGYKEGGPLFPEDENGKMLYSDVDFLETWIAMEDCVKQGLARTIGVSNFNKEQIERILSVATVPLVNNQVECHPYLSQKKLIEFCHSKNISVTAYSPLGSPDRPWAKAGEKGLMDDIRLKVMAEKYKKSVAQILIKYQAQRGVIVIPKSVTKSRIEANIQIFDFELSPEDIEVLDSYDCNKRFVGLEWVSDHKDFPFHSEY